MGPDDLDPSDCAGDEIGQDKKGRDGLDLLDLAEADRLVDLAEADRLVDLAEVDRLWSAEARVDPSAAADRSTRLCVRCGVGSWNAGTAARVEAGGSPRSR